MPRSGRDYLLHIIDETSYLLAVTQGMTRQTLQDDETLKRATVRSIEVIGEAVKQLPPALTQRYPDIEWKLIARMRDHLIHRYFGIDYDIVWDVLITKIVPLDQTVRTILRTEFANDSVA